MSGNAARRKAIEGITGITELKPTFDYRNESVDSLYGKNVYTLDKMEKRLPKTIFKSLRNVIENGGKMDSAVAEMVALSMKEWALEHGATHYAHVFYPLNGLTAEKHDSFYEPVSGTNKMIASFSGKALIQGESDASSFPHGGIRATFEARGYTVWDVTSPAYIMENVNGATLCIPTAFVSWTGDALDKKTPLLRSMHALNRQAQRVLKMFGHENPGFVEATAGPEQEYFLVDHRLYHLRPDLYTCGRTLYGARPARGQEFEDQYYGTIPERVLAYMMEVERECFKVGIPIKTRHNEVAPAQFEVAPIFETANVAHDHQQLTMTILKKTARKHGFVCLMAEKPFAGVNGSGKHVNFSLGNAKVGNLLEPGANPHENAQFLTFATAVLRAVSIHQGLLRAFVASAGNDHRLGANEAPPAIMSVYLGMQLADIFEQIRLSGNASGSRKSELMHIGVDTLPSFARDTGDRNRTSPFAFTGNKFEFRSVGSNFSIAGPLYMLNTIVADSLEYMADRLEKTGAGNPKKFNEALQKLLQEIIGEHYKIIFNGNGYAEAWKTEAKKRGLKNLRTTPEALPELTAKTTLEAFERQKVLTKYELEAREELTFESYVNAIRTESKLMLEIGHTQIYPAVARYVSELAMSRTSATDAGIKRPKSGMLERVAALQTKFFDALNALEETRNKMTGDVPARARYACEKILPAMEKTRALADELEEIVADDLWPLPSYQELLFLR